jgi:hypothetical protein
MRRSAVLLGALLVLAADLPAQVARRPTLFKDSRAELAQALARGEADVLVVMAAMPGRNGQLAAAVEAAGGTIQFREDEVDYLRARIPLDGIDSVTGHPALHSIDVSLTPGRPRAFALASGAPGEGPGRPGSPEAGAPSSAMGAAARQPHAATVTPGVASHTSRSIQAADTVWPPVLSDRPLTHRYHPWGDTRALSFLEENPTYDGRGVKVAMIDMNPDVLLPELQVARSLDGTEIPKVAVYGTALDVREEDDGRWLHMDEVVDASGGTLRYRDTTYTAPREGTFRMARFDETADDQSQSEALDGDVNRDGNPDDGSRLFGVLWDRESGEVWVDTDQDLDFSDETVLTDARTAPRFGVFGSDDPDTPVRESVAFGVQVDRERSLVALNLGAASHASLVVGAAVGSRGENGRFDGMAPGAQLISLSEGGAAYGQTESTIQSAQAGADVMYFEQSSYITRTYLLRDGRLVPSVIGDRVVARYGVSILSPTHNYPIVGAIDDIVMGRGVIGVNGHEGKDNFFLNHGVRVEHDDNLLITGGYGPMGNGAFKPDVISPSNYVSTAQGFVEGRAIPGLFQLPPGYTIAGGTSTATPTAAGAVALLISGARQAGMEVDPYTLKWAVTRGARWVPHIAAYKQGNGVISVAGAWDILNRLSTGAMRVDITARAPVRHPYSHLLPTPHEGVGLYERGGWEAGDREERILTLTRTSGPDRPMTFRVTWEGNEHGTFASAAAVTLPLNRPVGVPVTVSPEGPGVHTAHMTLHHDEVAGYAYRSLATVVVPRPLNAGNAYRQEVKVQVPRPGITSRFIEVPQGTQALVVDLGWEEREVSLAVSAPDTRQVRGESHSRSNGTTQVIHDPMPGVWEIRLSDIADTRTFDWEQAREEEPVPATPATLTVSAHRVEVSPLSADEDGAPAARSVRLTNRMATFTGGATGTFAGSARRETLELVEGEQRLFEVEVLPGSTALLVALGHLADAGADLDVSVFDCTDEEEGCRAAKVDGDPVGDERVLVLDPAPGTWKVVVDAFAVPSGSTSVAYLDAVLNPSYGAVNATDLPQERKSGDRWLVQVGTWLQDSAAAEGRTPFAGLLVTADVNDEAVPVALTELAHR